MFRIIYMNFSKINIGFYSVDAPGIFFVERLFVNK